MRVLLALSVTDRADIKGNTPVSGLLDPDIGIVHKAINHRKH
jgi:hypothetical protein